MPELLSPAGNFEKMKAAIRYGADAVYLAGKRFGMRSAAENFTDEELAEAIAYAHSFGKKVHITVNTLPRTNEYPALREYFEFLGKIKPDALIIADAGVFALAREVLPETEIHVSTQAGIVSAADCLFWRSLGAKRAVLARELSLDEIIEIRKNVPDDFEIETFVHGSMCVSFSGRCLLSNALTGRDGNRGACAQPCRWSYRLVEETRPNEYLEINQDGRGSHILSPKDLCLVKQLAQMIDAGVDSFKVEGRTKSLYYVSAVAKTYRQAIDEILKNPSADMEKYFLELQKVGNRGYTTGFALGDNNGESYSYDISKGLAGADFLCEFRSDERNITIPADYHLVKVKNKMLLGDEVEIITPDEQFVTKVEGIKDGDGEDLELGNTNADVYIKFSQSPKNTKYALVRTVGIKG